MKVHFEGHGPLFNNPQQHIQKAINKGLRDGIDELRDKAVKATPVDTGLMQQSWSISRIRRMSCELLNSAPYKNYVIGNTPQLKRITSQEFAQSVIANNISKQLKRELGE